MQVGKVIPQERVFERMVEHVDEFRVHEIGEEVVTFPQQRCHFENMMEDIFGVVRSNPQACVQRNVEQGVDVPVRKVQEQSVQDRVWKKSLLNCLLKYL